MFASQYSSCSFNLRRQPAVRQHFNDHSNLLWNILTEIEAQWGDHNDECLYMQQRVPWQDRFIIQRLTQNFILYSEKTPRNCIYSIRGHRVYFGLLMIKTMQRKKTCSVKAEECLSLMVKSVKSCRLVSVRHLKMSCCNIAGGFFFCIRSQSTTAAPSNRKLSLNGQNVKRFASPREPADREAFSFTRKSYRLWVLSTPE